MSINIIDEQGQRINSVDYIVKNSSFNEVKKNLSKYQKMLMVAALASFLGSAILVVQYFAGGSLNPAEWTGQQAVYAMLGLLIVAVVVAAETALFASGYRGTASIILTCVFVLFGLYTEISQSMEREMEGVKIRSQESPTYQAAL